MKKQESKESQKILSIEEYKKKRATAKTTATGELPQTPQTESGQTASILTFTTPRQKEEPSQKASAISSTGQKGSVIYMKDYLKSADSFKKPASPDWLTSLSENDISSAKTSSGGNIVMMNEYLKRKTLDQRAERDWEKDLQPSHSGDSQKWRAVAVAAVLAAMIAFPLLKNSGNEGMTAEVGKESDKNFNNQEARRELANKVKDTGRKPNNTEFFQNKENGVARRSPQSLSMRNNLLSSARQGRKPTETVIKSGRKPTLKEQQNGY